MANLIKLDCATNTPNTGRGRCSLDLGLLKYLVAVPRGTTYNAAAQANIIATLNSDALTNPASTRVYPIGPFVSATDSSTDSTVETTDYGPVIFVRDGDYNWTFRTIHGGLFYYRALRGFNNSQDRFDWLLGFDKGIVGTNSDNGDLAGIRASMVQVPNMKLATGSAAAQYLFNIQIADSTQINDNLLFVDTNKQGIADMPGIIDVLLTGTVNTSPAGSADVLPQVIAGGDSLLGIFGSTLASPSMWVATNFLTGNTITITGVSQVNGKYRVQLDTTDTDYPAASAKWNLTLAAVSVLFPAGVEGYEATNTLTFTRP